MGEVSFFPKTVQDWNALPEMVVQASNADSLVVTHPSTNLAQPELVCLLSFLVKIFSQTPSSPPSNFPLSISVFPLALLRELLQISYF